MIMYFRGNVKGYALTINADGNLSTIGIRKGHTELLTGLYIHTGF